MSTFFNNLESYGLFLIYKMLIWTSRNIPNVGLFSAYAEVFLDHSHTLKVVWAFLCLRRGVSILQGMPVGNLSFSLPTQRCFYVDLVVAEGASLFSAYAEVFPYSVPSCIGVFAFLCLRRGVSHVALVKRGRCGFSLPTQRCF